MGALILALYSIQFFIKLIHISVIKFILKQNGMQMMDGKWMKKICTKGDDGSDYKQFILLFSEKFSLCINFISGSEQLMKLTQF